MLFVVLTGHIFLYTDACVSVLADRGLKIEPRSHVLVATVEFTFDETIVCLYRLANYGWSLQSM